MTLLANSDVSDTQTLKYEYRYPSL